MCAERMEFSMLSEPPNGSRLSCGRSTRWRKAVEQQKKGSSARQRNSSLLVSARQLQAHVRRHALRYLRAGQAIRSRRPLGAQQRGPTSGITNHHVVHHNGTPDEAIASIGKNPPGWREGVDLTHIETIPYAPPLGEDTRSLMALRRDQVGDGVARSLVVWASIEDEPARFAGDGCIELISKQLRSGPVAGRPRRWLGGKSLADVLADGCAVGARHRSEGEEDAIACARIHVDVPPNGSRLSCGRPARRHSCR